MPTAISNLTIGSTVPAQSLLSLASDVVRSLHSNYTQQHQKALTAGDEDAEVEHVENLADVELTLKELDPVYWKELADKRLQSTGGYTSWTATELTRRAEPQTRINILLELGRIPKASWVVPEAVKQWRESRGTRREVTGEAEKEDAQLDLLVFLSEKRERAGLFKLADA